MEALHNHQNWTRRTLHGGYATTWLLPGWFILFLSRLGKALFGWIM